nr:receptor-type tyrosine-protein phosphatase F-like [Penaeus vannamei]
MLQQQQQKLQQQQLHQLRLQSSSMNTTLTRSRHFHGLPDTPIEVTQGASLNVTCAAEGTPMPYVQWVKRDENLHRINMSERVLGEAILVLDGVSDSDSYTCEAESESGFVSREIDVLALGPPPPQNVRLSFLTETQAAIAWDPVEEAKFYTVFKNYSSSQGEAVDVFESTIYTFAGLEPYTKYEFRVAVVTANDQIALSDSIFAITGDTAPDQPTIEGLDAVLKFSVGDTVNLTCSSGGGLSPRVMRWFKDGVEMASAESSSGVELSLVLQEEDDGAELLCQAKNYVAAVNTSVVARIKEGA